ncbi:MAG: hypothetical protein KDI75_06990 [Xanthomonadales bacterium]|nr:hypothetical protein [Xanthomonadales bacterium]
MPSSTSSSESPPAGHKRPGRRWGAIWLGVAIATTGVVAGAEATWRSLGFTPGLQDSAALWSIQRDRVYGNDPVPLVFLGASRTQYGFDLDRLRRAAPAYQPIMLAVNGLYPMAALRDLARDTNFRGIVVCDVELLAFWPEFREYPQEYVSYYHQQWTPSWRIHREVLSRWQELSVLGSPRFSWLSALRYATSQNKPFHDYAQLHRSREGDIDYQLVDTEASKRHFAEAAEGNLARLPIHNPDDWFQGLDEVFGWVRRIQSRGGRVIFYRSPVSGPQETIIEERFPAEQYWNRFLKASPAPVIDANRIPVLDSFLLPDDSHLDYRDKAAYTLTWLQVMQDRGLLESD